MVQTRSTVEAFLQELEQQLPLNRAFPSPLFTEFSREVLPVLDLSQYDPDSNSGSDGAGAANFGQFGTLVALELGTKGLTSVGAQFHSYAFDEVPAGEIHVYRHLNLLTTSAVVRDWRAFLETTLFVGESTIANWRMAAGGTMDINSFVYDSTGIAVEPGNVLQNSLVLFPKDTLIILSVSTIADTKISRLDFRRERYATNKVPTNESADLTATLI